MSLLFCIHKKRGRTPLTGGLVSISALSNVILLIALLGSRHFFHFSDFRHAEFGVVVKERATAVDGEVVLGPVPQLTQVLVVQGIEGVKTVQHKIKEQKNRTLFEPFLFLFFFFLTKTANKRVK